MHCITLVLMFPLQEILYSKGTVQGKIVRPMRIVDPEQDEYCGLVQAGIERECISSQLYFSCGSAAFLSL